MKRLSRGLEQVGNFAARRVLRTPEAADYIGLSPSTLEKMRGSGDGPVFVRLGGRAVGYDIQDLDDWLDEQRNSSTTGDDEAT